MIQMLAKPNLKEFVVSAIGFRWLQKWKKKIEVELEVKIREGIEINYETTISKIYKFQKVKNSLF